MNGSRSIRRSIEVEYWVVDEAGGLVEPGALVGAAPGVEREFVEPMLEIKTTPCSTTEALREELFDRLRAVLRRADDLGKRLVPLATPVHVEQQPGREIDQLNALVALDPALALVNSSPYFRGRRLAAGARSKLYRWMAYDDLPHQGRLWRYAEDRADWTRRLERRYEDFVTAATEAGIDRRPIHTDFDPESSIWTPVQLRKEFGTVEWRSADTALPSQVVRLADDLVGVVERLADAEVRIDGDVGRVTESSVVLPEFDIVLEYVEAAIRDGLESEAVRSYLDRMGFDVDSYAPIADRVDGQAFVSAEAARELRLKYATRLERDVRQRSSISAD